MVNDEPPVPTPPPRLSQTEQISGALYICNVLMLARCNVVVQFHAKLLFVALRNPIYVTVFIHA